MDKRLIKLVCENCNGTLEVDENKKILYCPYCGSKNMVVESDDVKIEEIRSRTKIATNKQNNLFSFLTKLIANTPDPIVTIAFVILTFLAFIMLFVMALIEG